MNYREDYAIDRSFERDDARSISEERIAFIKRTYAHLALAILAFIGIEALLMSSMPLKRAVAGFVWGGTYNWFLFIGAFVLLSVVFRSLARASNSLASQYLGLALYVVLQAFLFMPLMIMAVHVVGKPELIQQAGVITLAMVAGLTAVVFTTRKDFSFLRSALTLGMFLAFGTIIAAIAFSFPLGAFFALAMIALASGFILYDTSNVLHHYPTDHHVAASIELFASIAMLFWYVLYYMILLTGRD